MNWFLASVIVKSDLRKSQLNRRLHLPQDEYLDRSKKIQTNIVESEIFQEANLIACYLPIKNEVDTSYIIKSCFDLNKLIVVPKIISNSMVFTLHKVDDAFVVSKFGIKETDNEEISVNDIELFICPCLAYNKSGNRLGYLRHLLRNSCFSGSWLTGERHVQAGRFAEQIQGLTSLIHQQQSGDFTDSGFDRPQTDQLGV